MGNCVSPTSANLKKVKTLPITFAPAHVLGKDPKEILPFKDINVLDLWNSVSVQNKSHYSASEITHIINRFKPHDSVDYDKEILA